jgi:hypothetical protein
MGAMQMRLTEIDYGSSINSLNANIYQFSGSRERILLTEPVQIWHGEAVSQLEKLVHLQPGWDGYQAEPVLFANATFALRMLESICGDNAPAPQIVPGASGDLQIEWHTLHGDIELHVKAPNDVRAWHSQFTDGTKAEEIDLTFDFIEVAAWVKKVTESAIAITTAAA